MFKQTPEINKTNTDFMHNSYNMKFNLVGALSTTEKPYSNFGILLFTSTTRIPNFKATYELVNTSNSILVFLEDNTFNSKINNGNVTYTQSYSLQTDQETLYVYATPFTFNNVFLQKRKTNLAYKFSKSVELVVKTNNQINKNNVLDYSIVEKIQKFTSQTFISTIPTSMAISEMFTAFTDERTITNYVCINHLLLSKQQDDNVSKIININSKKLNQLITPIVTITRDNIKIPTTNIKYNSFSFISFIDEYNSNYEYKLDIKYNFYKIKNYISNLILNYKKTNSKQIELLLLQTLNIDSETLTEYVNFYNRYNLTSNKQEYKFDKLFDDILIYLGINKSASNTKQTPNKTLGNFYQSTLKINVPFKNTKHISLSDYSLVNNEIIAKPQEVKYNNKSFRINTNKDLYNILLINKSDTQNLSFNEFVNKNSISIVNKSKTKPTLKSNVGNNFVQDFKLTNQKVTINEPFQKSPTKKSKELQLTQQQINNNNNLSRDLVHSIFGTLQEYKNSDNLKMNYYLEYAIFDPLNLKSIKWSKITPQTIQNLSNNQLIFVKSLPDFSDVNISNDIFNFSYEYVKLTTVGQLINNVP